jgi:hypothetical protein
MDNSISLPRSFAMSSDGDNVETESEREQRGSDGDEESPLLQRVSSPAGPKSKEDTFMWIEMG